MRESMDRERERGMQHVLLRINNCSHFQEYISRKASKDQKSKCTLPPIEKGYFHSFLFCFSSDISFVLVIPLETMRSFRYLGLKLLQI
jgi:hypothetical protein